MRATATARWSTTVLGLLTAFFGWVDSAHAARALYALASPPAWVKPAAADLEAQLPAGGAADGSWYLLLDRQYNIRADGNDVYEHTAARITSSGGVDDFSTLDLQVDPTYQTLEIHSLKVIRDGHVNEQLRSARITALPQETELREKIYNGGYNINVLLSDVRVGDTVDYAYTIHSQERIFPGVFSTGLIIGRSTPVHRLRVRLQAPASSELSHRVVHIEASPTETLRGGLRELEWDWNDLPGRSADADRPRWHSVWPHLQVSNSRDWAEVATRATPLFQVNEAPSPELRSVAAEIRKNGGTPEEQALHALQFVQDKIRYVSISIGRGAFRPSSPNTVLSRRFGDCKDKSLLLVTLLRQLGIEADPVLVNTRTGHVLNQALPTPYSFDHAIARVKIGEQTFWADGTADEQFSPLTPNAPSTYGWGLVVNKSTTALTHIPGPLPNGSVKKSEVLIDLSKGINAPGTLVVATSYGGKWADEQRDELANDNPQKRRSDYANYMADNYPDAKMSAPLEISDDKVHNLVKVTEHYDLPRTFTLRNGRKELFLQSDEMYQYASHLKSSVRSTPLAIPYPADVQQTIRVILPRKWDLDDDTVRIDNPAFHYVSTVKYSETGASPEVVLDYRYQSLTDVVEVAALNQYLKDRGSMDDDLGFYIREPEGQVEHATFQVRKPVRLTGDSWFAIGVGLIVGLYWALRVGYRWDPETGFIDPSWPVGIRGWLILFDVIAVATAGNWPVYLWHSAANLDVAVWSHLPFEIKVSLQLFTMLGVLIGVALILTAVLLLKKRSSVPALFIGTQCAIVLWTLASQLYQACQHLLGRTTVGDVLFNTRFYWIPLVVYICYFTLSQRVKATFVNRYPATLAGTKVARLEATTQTQAVDLPIYK